MVFTREHCCKGPTPSPAATFRLIAKSTQRQFAGEGGTVIKKDHNSIPLMIGPHSLRVRKC